MASRFIPITPKTKLSVTAGRNLAVPSERPSPRRSLRQAVWIFELDPRTAFRAVKAPPQSEYASASNILPAML